MIRLEAKTSRIKLRYQDVTKPHLVVFPGYVGNIHVVGRGADIFKLLLSKYVKSNKVNLEKHLI